MYCWTMVGSALLDVKKTSSICLSVGKGEGDYGLLYRGMSNRLSVIVAGAIYSVLSL